MNANWNWLQGLDHHADEPSQPQAMPVFAGQKLVVVGGSAVIIGQDPGKVDDTVQALAKDGKAYGITADLADREQVERVRRQLVGEHADATLLVNAAGYFIPKPFLDYDGASYDSYLELDRAIFFLTQTAAAAWLSRAAAGPSSTSAVCGLTRPSGLPRPRATLWVRAGCTR
jgi:NAD(P)-dependent dehydrogenase (short-subunit alcohol dehydrogenase family)